MALKNSGFQIPPRRITVNISPADIRKEGSAYDLPIAIGIMVSLEKLGTQALWSLPSPMAELSGGCPPLDEVP